MTFRIDGIRFSDRAGVMTEITAASEAEAVQRATALGIYVKKCKLINSHHTANPTQQPSTPPVAPQTVVSGVDTPGQAAPRPFSWPSIRTRKGVAVAVLAMAGIGISWMSLNLGFGHSSSHTYTQSPFTPPVPAMPVADSGSGTPPSLPANVVVVDGVQQPKDGYAWDSLTDKTSVHWAPGTAHSTIPHIHADTEPDKWAADAGYRFDSSDSLAVTWTAGEEKPDAPHVESADQEGYWRPMDGYEWVTKDPMVVKWSPGMASREHPNVVAGTTEGKLQAADGFKWASDDPKDYSVVAAGPTQEQIQSACGKILGALILNAAAKPDPDDSDLQTAFRVAFRNARDEAVRGALTDLFSEQSASTIQSATNLICLAADGQLTADNWLSANAHDELMSRLRQDNPDAANVAELADFIAKVASQCSNSN